MEREDQFEGVVGNTVSVKSFVCQEFKLGQDLIVGYENVIIRREERKGIIRKFISVGNGGEGGKCRENCLI